MVRKHGFLYDVPTYIPRTRERTGAFYTVVVIIKTLCSVCLRLSSIIGRVIFYLLRYEATFTSASLKSTIFLVLTLLKVSPFVTQNGIVSVD